MFRFDPRRLRRTILQMAYAGQAVHVACAFSLVEILAVLHRNHLSPAQDHLILSKGHGVMAQYACLRELGWITSADVRSYFQDGTRLKGLSDAHIPGLEVSSGSLGHGLSVGVGVALAAKRKRTDERVYAIVGDGEMNEGACWEALLFAAHFELANLCVIVDANGFQAMGSTREVMSLGRLRDKFAAFGFIVMEADGHDETALDVSFMSLRQASALQPRALIAHTVKGKGVSFMQGDNRWHYTRLDAQSYAAAMRELQDAA
jgi:transketolase